MALPELRLPPPRVSAIIVPRPPLPAPTRYRPGPPAYYSDNPYADNYDEDYNDNEEDKDNEDNEEKEDWMGVPYEYLDMRIPTILARAENGSGDGQGWQEWWGTKLREGEGELWLVVRVVVFVLQVFLWSLLTIIDAVRSDGLDDD